MAKTADLPGDAPTNVRVLATALLTPVTHGETPFFRRRFAFAERSVKPAA